MELYDNFSSAEDGLSLYSPNQTLYQETQTRDSYREYLDNDEEIEEDPSSFFIVKSNETVTLYFVIANRIDDGSDTIRCDARNQILGNVQNFIKTTVIGYPKMIYILKILRRYTKQQSVRPDYYIEDFIFGDDKRLRWNKILGRNRSRFSISRHGQAAHAARFK